MTNSPKRMLVVLSLITIRLVIWILGVRRLLHLRKDVSRLAWSRPTQFSLPNLLVEYPINQTKTLLSQFQNLAETRPLKNHINNLRRVLRGLRMWTKKRVKKQAQTMEVSRVKKKCLKNTTFPNLAKTKVCPIAIVESSVDLCNGRWFQVNQ